MNIPGKKYTGKIYSGMHDIPRQYIDKWQRFSANHIYFLSWNWFSLFVETVVQPPEKTPIIGIEDDTGNPKLILPLWKTSGEHSTYIRTIRSLSNYYSCFFRPILFSEDKETAAIIQKMSSMLEELNEWDVINIAPMNKEANLFATIENTLGDNFKSVETYFSFGNWYLPLSGQTFSDYFKTRPSRLRNTFKRKYKKLSISNKVTFSIYDKNGPELEKAIDDYTVVYKLRWGKTEPYKNFIPGLIRSLASDGYLRLGILYLNHKPVSAQIWICQNQKAYIYKLAYDPAFGSFSVGTIHTIFMFEHVIEIDNVKYIDYLSGDDDYKKQWMTNRREMWGIQINNSKTLRGNLMVFKSIVHQCLENRN